jgi:CRISPR-associated protein Cmr6
MKAETRLPLYRSEAVNAIERQSKCPDGAHAGLWYEKFCNLWDSEYNLGNQKIEWIRTVAGTVGNEKLLEIHHARIRALVKELGGILVHAKTAGRFVTGLGRSHPVENGFAWHHTLGTAYLPGSSVKGMLRSFVREWGNEAERERIPTIFGNEPKGSAQVGSIVFFDALPAGPIRVEEEIMTPHYTRYYQDPQREKPLDWHSPVPIPFLAVGEGQEFVFPIAPRRPDAGNEELHQVAAWLGETLQWIGAGAKTAVGYGRFDVVKVETFGM